MTDIVSDHVIATPPPRIKRRYMLSAVAGNAFEFYDFVTYSFFAKQIGDIFFPSHLPLVSLLASLATFGVGFATRPLGGILLGIYADRRGRAPAMILSFMMMGFGILVMALTPSYAAIGIAAPVLLIVARLVQGFALGGQVGPSTAYLLEGATAETRGFYTALQYASQGLAIMVGGVVGVILASVLDAASIQEWGWRVAIGLGGLILPFGMLIRRNMPETIGHAASVGAAEHRPRRTGRVKAFALALAMLGGATIATYVINNMTTYASTFLNIPAQASFAAPVVSGACVLLFSLLSGWMSDKLGRWPVMVVPRIFFLAAIYPCFLYLSGHRTGAVLLIVTGIIASLNTWSSAANLVNITETMPAEMRSGALGTVYALAIATFGGSAPYIVTWLIGRTHNVLAPAWYLTAATAISVVAMLFAEETAPMKLRKLSPPT